MKEGIIHGESALVAHDQPTEVSQPGKGAFDFPPPSVTSQCSPILGRRFSSVAAMWADQLDAPLLETVAQRVAVVGAVGDEALGLAPGPASSSSWHPHLGQRPLDQLHLCRRGAVQVVSQRNTLAVDHHHPLGALAALGFADALAPFLAGAKLPSMKLSLQSSWPRRSSSARNCRHTLSQMPSASHWWRRRQQVAGLTPKSEGRSRQRAPVRNTQRMPSSTARLSFHGRPALEYCGKSGSSLAHCLSDNMGFAMPSFSRNRCKSTSTKYLRKQAYETSSSMNGANNPYRSISPTHGAGLLPKAPVRTEPLDADPHAGWRVDSNCDKNPSASPIRTGGDVLGAGG